jgi:thiol-disulfide isomerase/thioredoxin
VQEIKTINELNSFLSSYNFALIHFWAEWNGSDYIMKKNLAGIENEFNEKVYFGLIDVDNDNFAEFLRQIPIVNVPTLIYYKDKNIEKVDIGLKNPDELRQNLSQYFN